MITSNLVVWSYLIYGPDQTDRIGLDLLPKIWIEFSYLAITGYNANASKIYALL